MSGQKWFATSLRFSKKRKNEKTRLLRLLAKQQAGAGASGARVASQLGRA